MRPGWRRSPTLSIDKTGTYTLRATDGTRVTTSTSFVIGAGTSSSITVVAGNGQSAAVTTNYASQLKVSVQDALGNGVPGVVVTFAAPSSGASVTFSGPATVTTGIGGVAAISVTANTQVGSFEVTASAPGTAAPAVFSLTNVAGSASHLAFVQQPSGAVAGAVIAPPVTVQLTDSIGNNVAQAGVAVTLTLNPAAGRLDAITGTTTVATSASGLASFADLSIATAGSYQLTAVGTSLVSAQSSAFTITAGPASTITVSGGSPQSTTVLAPFAVPLQVLVSDSAGNPLSGVAVTFAAPAIGSVGDAVVCDGHDRCRRPCQRDCGGQCDGGLLHGNCVGDRDRDPGELRADQRGGNRRQSGVHAAAWEHSCGHGDRAAGGRAASPTAAATR